MPILCPSTVFLYSLQSSFYAYSPCPSGLFFYSVWPFSFSCVHASIIFLFSVPSLCLFSMLLLCSLILFFYSLFPFYCIPICSIFFYSLCPFCVPLFYFFSLYVPSIALSSMSLFSMPLLCPSLPFLFSLYPFSFRFMHSSTPWPLVTLSLMHFLPLLHTHWATAVLLYITAALFRCFFISSLLLLTHLCSLHSFTLRHFLIIIYALQSLVILLQRSLNTTFSFVTSHLFPFTPASLHFIHSFTLCHLVMFSFHSLAYIPSLICNHWLVTTVSLVGLYHPSCSLCLDFMHSFIAQRPHIFPHTSYIPLLAASIYSKAFSRHLCTSISCYFFCNAHLLMLFSSVTSNLFPLTSTCLHLINPFLYSAASNHVYTPFSWSP